MGKKKKKLEEKPWCYYCDRIFNDEATLIQHQKAKHFKCTECSKKLNTAQGLATHAYQVHKVTITAVPAAKPGRESVELEIFGMAGVPEGMKPGAVFDEEPAPKKSRVDGLDASDPSVFISSIQPSSGYLGMAPPPPVPMSAPPMVPYGAPAPIPAAPYMARPPYATPYGTPAPAYPGTPPPPYPGVPAVYPGMPPGPVPPYGLRPGMPPHLPPRPGMPPMSMPLPGSMMPPAASGAPLQPPISMGVPPVPGATPLFPIGHAAAAAPAPGAPLFPIAASPSPIPVPAISTSQPPPSTAADGALVLWTDEECSIEERRAQLPKYSQPPTSYHNGLHV